MSDNDIDFVEDAEVVILNVSDAPPLVGLLVATTTFQFDVPSELAGNQGPVLALTPEIALATTKRMEREAWKLLRRQRAY